MTDVQLPHTVERQLDDVVVGLARKQGFMVSSHRIDILGRCEDCTQRL
jgi:Fe2+ or Zn2+ uptake regulation protein